MSVVIHVISRRVFPVAIFLTLPLKQQSEGKAWDEIRSFFSPIHKSKMVLELHVWGPAFSLPSIDAQCLATIAYFSLTVPKDSWVLVASSDPTASPTRTLSPHYQYLLFNLQFG